MCVRGGGRGEGCDDIYGIMGEKISDQSTTEIASVVDSLKYYVTQYDDIDQFCHVCNNVSVTSGFFSGTLCKSMGAVIKHYVN